MRRSCTTMQQSPHRRLRRSPPLSPIPRPTQLTTPNGIRIQSAVLPQYTSRPTDGQTDRPTDGIGDSCVPRALKFTLYTVSEHQTNNNTLLVATLMVATDRIAATHGSFSGIRHVTPICTPSNLYGSLGRRDSALPLKLHLDRGSAILWPCGVYDLRSDQHTDRPPRYKV